MIRRYPNGATQYIEDVLLRKQSEPGELKHLSTRRKRNRRDSVSSGERKRISPKVYICLVECFGKNNHRRWKSCTRKAYIDEERVGRDTWNPVWIWGDHPPRLNTPERPIVNKYCEGKVKSTSNRRVKENLKPYAYKRSEQLYTVTACLLHNEPTS